MFGKRTESVKPTVHILKWNGSKQAPYADFTLCGTTVNDATDALWPKETLSVTGAKGVWCKPCKKAEHAWLHQQ